MVEHVDRWLESLGLGKYAALFAENEVSADVLPDLTESDLEKLGVPLGARKKIIKAASTLDPVAEPDRRPALAEASAAGAPFTSAQGERRQLTVMFVDLVGSTALSAKLDPEEMGAVLRAYQNAVAGEIERVEGHVAKFMGDGVLAYFGWPRAHEHEAERAVRVGLAVRDAVSRLSGGDVPLVCRVGIATGPVVVGELIGQGTASEQTVVGDTPNLAARLQALAAPGQVVVAETTRLLLGAGFLLDDLGEQQLKGIEKPVSAFTVTGERSMPSRFEARGGNLQPMVGREMELALLMERWSQTKTGDGQCVLLTGEAGIGKSRMIRAVLDSVAGEPHCLVRLQCSPYHRDSALWPVKQYLRRAAGLHPDDVEPEMMGHVAALLADDGDYLPLILELFGIESATTEASRLPPQTRRLQLLEGLQSHLLSLARQQPLVVVIEDLHWIDPTTFELVENVLVRITTKPALLLVTARPDTAFDVREHGHLTRLALNRLGRAGVERLVRAVSGNGLAPATVDAIIERTDGVPLFVEELTKSVIEAGTPIVPASLQDALMARLDHGASAKRIAQVAACIGRDFDLSLLDAVVDVSPSEVLSSLESLRSHELIWRVGSTDDEHFRFKHALIRDVAYQSLLKSQRKTIHGRIAEQLRLRRADPAVLARHATAAEQWSEALTEWLNAAKLALERASYREAIANAQQGIAASTHLRDSTAESHSIVAAHRILSWASAAVGDPRGMTAHLEKAEEHARRQADRLLVCEVLVQRVHFANIFGGHVPEAENFGREAEVMALDIGLPTMIAAARFAVGQTLWVKGDYPRAIDCLEKDLKTHLGVGHSRDVATGSAGTLAIDAIATLGGCCGLNGDFAQAEQLGRRALELAESFGNSFDRILVRYHLGRSYLTQHRFSDALDCAEQAVRIAKDCNLAQLIPWNLALLGAARAKLGEVVEAMPLLDEAINRCGRAHLRYALAVSHLYRAMAKLDREPDSAMQDSSTAISIAGQHGFIALEVEARKLSAEAMGKSASFDSALAKRERRVAKQLAAKFGLEPLHLPQG
jgi:class 3 adenylate cyclase/tetratricopeptide (TPR) repeat protein